MSSAMKTLMVSILLLLVVSCTGGAEQATASVNPAEGVTPSIEIQNTATVEALPAQTATPVFTSTPSMTLTSTIETHNQVTPTVQDENKWASIQDLMENNGYCELPCLWGITPGVTTWDSIEPFLLSIADKIGYGNETTLRVDKIEHTLYPHYYRYRPEGYSEILAINFLTNPTGIVEAIITGVPLPSEKFQINQILSDYGEPEEILLESTNEYPPGYRQWYWIVLLYPEYGFAAFYEGEGESVDEGIQSCPGLTGPDLSLFSYGMTVETLVPLVKTTIFSDVGIPESISEIPGLTITEVYNALLDPAGCIVIPLPDYLQ